MKNVFKHLEGRLRTINSYSFPFSKRAMLFLEIDRKSLESHNVLCPE